MERLDLERNKEEEEGTGSEELRVEEFLKLGNEECSRDGREVFLKDILKKPSINEVMDSE